MYTTQLHSMFDTLEGYENFVSQLLQTETTLPVDPLLEWEDGMLSHNFFLRSLKN